MTGPTSHTYFSQRLRLHYVDWGNPSAPPLVLVHGGRDHCRNWDWVAERLHDRYHIIAPDLRGHGDSEWNHGGTYRSADYLYDLAQLLRHADLGPVRLVGHSLGGSIVLRFAGLYPEQVTKLVAIEGLGPAPPLVEKRRAVPAHERLARWMEELRGLSGRLPRRYAGLDEAVARMQEANRHLSPEQARHLTVHGMHRNEDGSYSWKFDNYVRADPPFGMLPEHIWALWERITCPTLLIRGAESWASDPVVDGRIKHFRNARLENVDGAGHWVQHDRLEAFLGLVEPFLA